jgi:predicted TPR repeat methyltransferase
MVNINCPICFSSDYTENIEFSRILGIKKPFHVIECAKCGLRSLQPQLTENELSDLYGDSYFNNNQITNLKFDNLATLTQYEYDVHTRFSKFRATLENFIYLNGNFKKLLDVGAATGDMVNIAREMDFKADGIELSSYAIAKAKEIYNIDLMQKFLSDVEDNSYELIHLNHVFEHFNNPSQELKHLNRILIDKGILYIEIPYQFHIVERLKYRYFSQPRPFTLHSIHHPYFYTVRTIKSLVENSGFEIIKINVFSHKRYKEESNGSWFKSIFWYILSLFRLGNFIELYARKKS